MYRLVTEKVASLAEIETHYSLTDVYDMNEALDLLEDAKVAAQERADAEAKRGR